MAANTWETSSVASTFDADTNAYKRTGSREGTLNLNKSKIKKKSYKIVGMNANKVPEMRTAIRTYVNNVESHLQGIDALASANNAFQGAEAQAAVRTYISKVKDYCIGLTSQLLAFSDKIKDVENAWQKQTAAAAQTITSTGSAFANNTGKYTEKL